ncbi:SRPBCC domain-containing protein [Agriterribacter sp.]|uniref:SRPBCC family protein n=1 Tax=Agriterribacter sp. TaxID=2821509 RepID=UPI002BDF4CF6|nr:SRPBCC domain-containing protein [Agriterribacter sp.]HRP58034.1 SRPBCC domain-containing protein [Agriterribacter sp.]
MERKTKVHAEEGRQDLIITREFDLSVALLFRAYTEAGIVEQWMGTKVLKLENSQHGGYAFETRDPQGNILFKAHGTIHDVVRDQKIVRTFEMDNAGFDAQLEFLEFEPLTAGTSRLTMQIIYRSTAHREQQLKLPFAYGINMAHDRLQEVVTALK